MKQNRFSTLIEKITSQDKNMNDWWIKEYESNLSTDFITIVDEINASLEKIDEDSWAIFENKLIKKFKNEDPYHGKIGFFNTLNECYAYQYLYRVGFSEIRFVEETNKKSTPDISYIINSISRGCEVKTITRSDKDYDRFSKEKIFDKHEAYCKLKSGFFNQLKEAIETASQQINNEGIIVLIIQFDDFTLKYIEQYKSDIKEWLRVNIIEKEVCILVQNRSEPFIEHNIELPKEGFSK